MKKIRTIEQEFDKKKISLKDNLLKIEQKYGKFIFEDNDLKSKFEHLKQIMKYA
jgi:hypothetical protein